MSLLLMMVVAQLFDLATFSLAAARLPIAGEANMIARFLYANTGLIGVVLLKVAAIGLVTAYVAWPGPYALAACGFMLVLGLAAGVVNALAVLP